jgi:hypothetical protein
VSLLGDSVHAADISLIAGELVIAAAIGEEGGIDTLTIRRSGGVRKDFLRKSPEEAVSVPIRAIGYGRSSLRFSVGEEREHVVLEVVP